MLYVERGGKSLLSWTDDPALLEPCAAALAAAVREGALGRITVERADGETVRDTPLARLCSQRASAPPPGACACAARNCGAISATLTRG